MSRIAIVQHPSVLADRRATLERAVGLAEEAAEAGARLIVFPEAYISGYPTWIWRLRPGNDMALSQELHELLVGNAVDLVADDLGPLRAVAKGKGVDILCGIDEIDRDGSRATLFNSYVHMDATGTVVNVHRKLMPTNPERMVWGLGDGRGLRVIDTPLGRVGSLICWENFMPLARMALYAQGVDIYVAPTWDSSEGWTGTMQHIAREGRCYVASCCSAMLASDVPADFPGRAQLFPDEAEVINKGRSCLIEPGGALLVAPVEAEATILYGEVERQKVVASRRTLDVAGHYNRPDIFSLEVDRQPSGAATFEE